MSSCDPIQLLVGLDSPDSPIQCLPQCVLTARWSRENLKSVKFANTTVVFAISDSKFFTRLQLANFSKCLWTLDFFGFADFADLGFIQLLIKVGTCWQPWVPDTKKYAILQKIAR
jgi:hypothetical protein